MQSMATVINARWTGLWRKRRAIIACDACISHRTKLETAIWQAAQPRDTGHPNDRLLLFALGFDDLLAAIKTVGADVMAQVRFARRGLYREWRIGQEIMRPVHAAF